MWETSKSEQCLRVWWTDSISDNSLYKTGMLHPANSTILPPLFTCILCSGVFISFLPVRDGCSTKNLKISTFVPCSTSFHHARAWIYLVIKRWNTNTNLIDTTGRVKAFPIHFESGRARVVPIGAGSCGPNYLPRLLRAFNLATRCYCRHVRNHDTDAPKHSRPNLAQMDFCGWQRRRGEDDEFVLPGHSAVKGAQECVVDLDGSCAQSLRRICSKIWTKTHSDWRIQQFICHGSCWNLSELKHGVSYIGNRSKQRIEGNVCQFCRGECCWWWWWIAVDVARHVHGHSWYWRSHGIWRDYEVIIFICLMPSITRSCCF